MSSYIVNDDTINKVIAFVRAKQENRSLGWSNWALENEARITAKTDEEWKQEAEEWFQLNVQAVNSHYGEGEAEKFRPLDFEYRKIMPPSAVGAYKALANLMYQCADGDTSGLFESLGNLKNIIARYIVETSEAYKQAKWG